MELDFALLAEAASAGERAQVNVINGGFDSVEIDRLPVGIPIALVASFSIGIEGFEEPHSFRFDLRKPDGSVKTLGEDDSCRFPPPLDECRRSHITAVVKALLKFSDFGKYEIEIFADEQRVKTLPLHVVEKKTAETETEK